jgi:putative colanic acid biosynthesis UDP-glucose lipid carrier transferase
VISRRAKGLSLLQSWILLTWELLLFGLLIVIGVEWLNKLSYQQTQYGIYFLGILLAHLLRLGMQSQDSIDERLPGQKWMRALTKGNQDSLVLIGVLFALAFVTKDKGISRLFLGSYFLALWCSLIFLHRFLPDWLGKMLFGPAHRLPTLLIGGESSLRKIGDFLDTLPGQGFEITGRISLVEESRSKNPGKIPLLGSVKDLNSILSDYKTEQVIIVENGKNREWFRSVLDCCDQHGCHVMVYHYWQDWFDQPLTLNRFGLHTVFTLLDEPLQDPVNRILKRLLDLSIAIPVVLLILPPLCIWVAIVQSIQAPGPLLFIQKRSGLQRTPFNIYKFRSMTVQAPDADQGKQATVGDARLYRFGAFLRRSSLDEIPQFLNVLKGEMSVVGPRPHLIEHDALFAATINTYRIRHYVKPGITGLAQINGCRGEIKNPHHIQARVRHDLAYIHAWSLLLDLEIILKTIREVIRPSDRAY